MFAFLSNYKNKIEVTQPVYEVLKECASTDETRYFINFPYYDKPNNKFVATDGSRIAVINVIGKSEETLAAVEEGYFSPVKIGKKFFLLPEKCDGQFPNYHRVIPADSGKAYSDPQTGDMDMHITGKLEKDSITLFRILHAKGEAFNIESLQKTLKHVGSFTYFPGEPGRASMFTFSGGMFVIMPLNMNN